MVWVWYHYTHTIWYVVHTYGGTPPSLLAIRDSFIHAQHQSVTIIYLAMPYHSPHHHTLLLALHFVTTGTIVLSSGTIRYGRV